MPEIPMALWFGVAGLVVLVLVTLNYRAYRRLVRRGVTTVGRVVGDEEDSDQAQALIVVYEDQTGMPHRITTRSSMTHWGGRSDRCVQVAYDPSAPERARIWEDVRLQSLVGVALALVLLAIAAVKALGG